MGVFKGYQIEWINALTGEAIDTTEKISDSFGHLKLEFPDTLTGNATCPIMFFKLYRTDDTFLTPIVGNTFGISDFQFVQIDTSIQSIEYTHWSEENQNSEGIKVNIQPNPTTSIVNVIISTTEIGNGTYSLVSGNGSVLLSGNIISSNFMINLSVYRAGNYYLTIEIGQNRSIHKLIKL